MEDQFKDSADKAEDLLEKRKQIINMLSSTLQGAMYKVKGTSEQFKTIKDDVSKVSEMLEELSRLLEEITSLGKDMFKSGVLLYLDKPRYDDTPRYRVLCPKEEVLILDSVIKIIKGNIVPTRPGKSLPAEQLVDFPDAKNYNVLLDLVLDEEDVQNLDISDLLIECRLLSN